jgi:hypothetical protein
VRELFSIIILSLLVLVAEGHTATIASPDGGRQPQVTIDPLGNVHLTFGAKGKVFYTCSTDSGATYRKPTEVGELRSLALGMRRGPRIVVSGETIAITSIGGAGADSSNGNLYSWTSKDRGMSWRGPHRVNDVEASAREGLHGMAAGPKGELYAAWLDLRGQGTQIFGSRATVDGGAWSKNVLVYQSPDGTVCECCHPSVALDASGRLRFMTANAVPGAS